MLTEGQERFARAIAGGATGADALRLAYPASRSWKPAAVYSRASALARRPEVAARVIEFRRDEGMLDDDEADAALANLREGANLAAAVERFKRACADLAAADLGAEDWREAVEAFAAVEALRDSADLPSPDALAATVREGEPDARALPPATATPTSPARTTAPCPPLPQHGAPLSALRRRRRGIWISPKML